jgi:hypothetical protein
VSRQSWKKLTVMDMTMDDIDTINWKHSVSIVRYVDFETLNALLSYSDPHDMSLFYIKDKDKGLNGYKSVTG